MDRSDILFSMFDSTGFGLEVGPSYNPFLPKTRFNVETIDHADAATLRAKYRDNSKIEEVNYVSDGRGLLETIGQPERYDFIFASHVIEHVTDIVGFLRDCETLLKPAGRLVLAIPDKRYCFDALRPVSTVGQALQAHLERRSRHPPGVLFDYYASVCGKRDKIIWIAPALDDVHLIHGMERASEEFERAQATDSYHDVHGWQFTPTSFRLLIKQLRCVGYIGLGQAAFYKRTALEPGMHEFYVSLSKSAPVSADTDIELLKQVEIELREVSCGPLSGRVEDFESAGGEIATIGEKLNTALEKLHDLETMNAALLRSTSWRVTAPLRLIRRLLLAWQ